ncbi:hypothetical protein LC087_07515 [Bacillus carboniphilus]|uniref:Uncharacterized protein n=1 Tax=Bacillus carboniphilus TaxID=86663 RepID=A0ABY9JX31_9BACI|nr:hypothetical protein [Bacillus carboniphilus]WLR43947.1 hypothetical protein LC087_07515 [Bacillus carboniphilus]
MKNNCNPNYIIRHVSTKCEGSIRYFCLHSHTLFLYWELSQKEKEVISLLMFEEFEDLHIKLVVNHGKETIKTSILQPFVIVKKVNLLFYTNIILQAVNSQNDSIILGRLSFGGDKEAENEKVSILKQWQRQFSAYTQYK